MSKDLTVQQPGELAQPVQSDAQALTDFDQLTADHLRRIYRHSIPEPNSGCWLWTGSLNLKGYGHFAIQLNGKPSGRGAHRISYMLHVGPIPDGLDLDHICRVRCCVNPRHLEPVTRQVNVLRGDSMRAVQERAKNRTHCPQGHPYSGDNLAKIRNRKGRGCKACHNKKSMERYYRRKFLAAMNLP